MRALALIALLLAPCATSAQPSEASVPISGRVGIVAATALKGLATGFALGYRDGLSTDVRQAADDWGFGDDRTLAINRQWHAAGWVTKPMLVLDVGGALAIGGLTDPTLIEGLLLAASYGASVGLAFHFGYNFQQGAAWDYFGTVDSSDQVAKAIGPQLVVIGAVVLWAGIQYLTYLVLE